MDHTSRAMERSSLLQRLPWQPLLIVAAFAVALSPQLTDHLLFHPDERHYLDGGLEMLSTGDWWTPRTSTGEVRLHKPILAYWCVGAPGLLLEPSPWSTRLLFVLAGAALLCAGWCAAKQATGSDQAALITALLLTTHPAVLLSSTRALPDILLGLFLTISMAGYLAILTRGRADWGPLAAATFGGALAVLAKGLPAVAFVIYATGYLLLRQRAMLWRDWRRIAVLQVAALALPVTWFVLMYVRHGATLGEQFLGDQIGAGRFVSQSSDVLWQLFEAAGTLLASFALAWIVSLRGFWIRRRDLFAICDRPIHHFLLGWIGIYLTACACVNHVSARYLLPIVPALAVILGNLMTELEGPLLRRNLRRLAWIALTLLLACGLITFIVRLQEAPLTAMWLTALSMAIGYRLWREMRFTSARRALTVATCGLLATMMIASWCLVNDLGPSFGYQLLQALELQHGDRLPEEVVLIGDPAHASRLRVCSGGRIRVRHVAPVDAPGLPITTAVALLQPVSQLQLPAPVHVVPVPCRVDQIPLERLWQALRAGQMRELLAEYRREYWLTYPPSQARPSSPPATGAVPRITLRDDSETQLR